MPRESQAGESNAAFLEFWRKIYPRLPRGEYREMSGLAAVWADVILSFCNSVLLTRPLEDHTDLHSRVEELQIFLGARTASPMFLVCQEWVPRELRQALDSMIAPAGLDPAIPLHGMAADQILPPVRRLPDLEYQRVFDTETRRLICDVNSLAYGFAPEYGREAFDVPEFWQKDAFGYVAFLNGKAVASAATSIVGKALYVGFVATLPGAQRNGYAEAVMRHSLSEAMRETGIRRSLLHATDAGYPIYLRMGYHPSAEFTGYVRT